MKWVLMMPLTLIQPRAISSTQRAYVSSDSPRPPYSSGIISPKIPISFMPSTMACGYSSWCSSSMATGMICSSTNSRTSLISSVCYSVRPSVCWSRDMLGSPPCVWAASGRGRLDRVCRRVAHPGSALACEGAHLWRRSPELAEPDLLRGDRALERRTLAEVAALEPGGDRAQQLGPGGRRVALERLEEQVGEGAVGAAVEGGVRRRLVGLARGEEHRLGAGATALGQLDEGLAVDGPRRREGTDGADLLEAGGGRRRQEPGRAAEDGRLHDLLEVAQAGAAVARVEEHLEQHPLGHRREEVVQLVVDDDGVAVPLVAALADVVAGERLVEAVGLDVPAGLVGHLRAVAGEGEHDGVAGLGLAHEVGERGHDVLLRGVGVGEDCCVALGEPERAQSGRDVVGVVDATVEPARPRERGELVDPDAEGLACHGRSFLLEGWWCGWCTGVGGSGRAARRLRRCRAPRRGVRRRRRRARWGRPPHGRRPARRRWPATSACRGAARRRASRRRRGPAPRAPTTGTRRRPRPRRRGRPWRTRRRS